MIEEKSTLKLIMIFFSFTLFPNLHKGKMVKKKRRNAQIYINKNDHVIKIILKQLIVTDVLWIHFSRWYNNVYNTFRALRV